MERKGTTDVICGSRVFRIHIRFARDNIVKSLRQEEGNAIDHNLFEVFPLLFHVLPRPAHK